MHAPFPQDGLAWWLQVLTAAQHYELMNMKAQADAAGEPWDQAAEEEVMKEKDAARERYNEMELDELKALALQEGVIVPIDRSILRALAAPF